MIENVLVATLFAMLMPFVVSFLKNPRWSSWAKQLVSLGVALTFATMAVLAVNIANGDNPTLKSWLFTFTGIVVIAQTLYEGLLKDNGLSRLLGLPGINDRLTGGDSPPGNDQPGGG